MPLKVSDGIGSWIKDFKKSDDPRFAGKSPKQRRDQAIAAYLSAKNESVKEDAKADKIAAIKAKITKHQKARNDKRVAAASTDSPSQKRADNLAARAHQAKIQQAQAQLNTVEGTTSRADLDKAIAAFKKKGGTIRKVEPGKAQGYHGKDDPGKDVAGIMDRPDTKQIGTRKKVKSMGEAKQTHVFDNEKDARAKAKEIGGKYVKGVGKSMGKHAAIKTEGKNDARVDHEAAMQGHHIAAKSVRQDLRAVEAHRRAEKHHHDAIKHIDNNDHAAANKSLAAAKSAASVAKKYGGKISSHAHDDTHAVKSSYNEGYGGTSFSMKAMSKMKPQEKEKPPFDNAKPVNKDPKDKFGNPIKNRAKHLARQAARDLVNKSKNESSYAKLNQYHKDAEYSKKKATNSAVATILRKGDHSKDLDTRRKRERGLKLAKDRIINKIRRGDKK